MRIVIVGGVAGGASAATRARRVSESARITIFERGDFVSFANCGLPYHVGGEIEKRGSLLLVTPSRFEHRFNIQVHVRHEVTAIDRERRVVRVHDLQQDRWFEEPYDKLILAPGGTAYVPEVWRPLPKNVFVLRDMGDMDAIKAAVSGPEPIPARGEGEPVRAVVVGSGFIGLEMVEQLRRLRLSVTLVEFAPQVLPACDPEFGAFLEQELWSHRVEVVVDDGVGGLLSRDGRVRQVELESGERLDADLVILGMGIRPNVALAVEAGLPVGASGGVQVDEFQRTADENVYAVGDVVEYAYAPTGLPRPVALAGPANRSGRVAGEHAATAGCTVPMAPVCGTAVVRVFGQTLAMTGISESEAARLGRPAASVTIAADDHAGYFPGAREMFLKLVYAPEDGKLLGAQAVGPAGVDKRIDVMATVLRLGGTVRDLVGVDLAYAPPFGMAKDAAHMAAFAACNQLDGLVRFVPAGVNLSDAQVVDVRTAREVQSEPIPAARHALHIPMDQLRERLGELDASRPTVVVCRTGQRSYVAARLMRQRGFVDVASLSGGVKLRVAALAG
jgi:NADPH-dependent 2,4-dienoyl-CoA reductase/sulfur reductase-like enzyme/rhodanese-related sulfurtransferase